MTTGGIEVFEANRGRMFGIAYRMLGTATDAEDVVQDAWLRWQATDTDAVRKPAAFLATVVTRLCLTALDSARARREVYVGPWLPEPVDTASDPSLGAENGEALSFAVVLLLERLSPTERAAFVLHEAFAYSFREVAAVLDTSEANARQLAARARAHLRRERPSSAAPAERSRLLEAILAAAVDGDVARLESLLAEDAVAISDGGGKVLAARKVSRGRERVATFVRGVFEKYSEGLSPRVVSVNGETAVLGMRDETPIVLFTIDASPDGVTRLMMVLNPDKLAALAA